MAVMVWCQSCKKVVWAYDQQPSVDLRGLCNHLALPCPQCGATGNFNGWADRLPYEEQKAALLAFNPDARIFDYWSMMHLIAEREGVEWVPSGNNHWFPEVLNDQVKNLIQWERR